MNGSVVNVVCYEHGLLWKGLLSTSLLWTQSAMNGSVLKMVCYELVCYVRCLLWTWSVMNVVCYELVCYERGL